MDVEPEGPIAELGEGVRGKVPGAGHRFTVEGYGRHVPSVADEAE
ncbi:hypothetical protein BQ8420_30190 [Nocardiopsis sp. JB363]|nr:hypothetical protein BQ8420_30190 [Nocardiopsis sp. JB363]